MGRACIMYNYSKIIVVLFVTLSLVLTGVHGCKKSVSSDDRFTGSWSSKKGKIYRIMSFRANGTWSFQFRKEGRLAKIIEKSGKASGNWNYKDGFLYLYVVASEDQEDWKIDTTVVLEVTEITPLNMSLIGTSGQPEKWARVKSDKQSGESDQLATISLEPIVVNLKKEKQGGINRFLCVEMEFVLDEMQTPETPVIAIHPKVRETIIFYLSSLTYPEVNTMDDIAVLKNNLLRLLKPYMTANIEKLSIKNVVITSKWQNVETFQAQYQKREGKTGENKDGDNTQI